ncbi:MAG TPA: FliG C-terminal domain-containing protein [Thermoguttaceae bacterium]|nr:FliG C-terminal domain-containing protein [Thermoguttaceae bacterium]
MRTKLLKTSTADANDAGIRKAAVLVAGLDQKSADALLDALGEEQARRVRDAVVELGEIDPHEQRRVLDEFFRIQPMVPNQRPPGIELDGRLARKLSMPPRGCTAENEQPDASPGADPKPFHRLCEAEADKLARILANERPQTIALVLSHLPPEQAGNVLIRLPAELQNDLIHRLIDLEETDPAILRDVERALESRLSQQVRMQRRRVAGIKAVSDILHASDSRVGMQILDGLAEHDRPLAEQLGPQRLQFDDLTRLDDDTLDTVFDGAEPELLMIALVGAPPELIDRVVRRLGESEAEEVRHRLDHPGPIRLSDVEDARGRIAELARRMAIEGRIRLPEKQPLFVC